MSRDAPCCCRSFQEASPPQLTYSTLRQSLQQGLTLAFGNIGGAIPFEVLSLQQGSAVAYLKADKRCMLPFPLAGKMHQPSRQAESWP